MKLSLQITNIHGQIGINTNNAEQSIRQPQAELNIQTTPSELNMHTEHVRIRIDQSRCFAEAGLKSVFELTYEFAQRGIQASLEAIGNEVYEGNLMGAIKNKIDAIAAIAAQKAFPPPADFNIALMPQSRPKIDFIGGEVSYNPQMGNVSIEIRPNKAEINVTPGSVEIYMLQKPYFHFEFIGNNVDVST